eukprot:m.97324 g.97324  ORF g.97324 m.97324 type:complete len:83 (-) comp8985_c1_seq2:1377-1625(-)
MEGEFGFLCYMIWSKQRWFESGVEWEVVLMPKKLKEFHGRYEEHQVYLASGTVVQLAEHTRKDNKSCISSSSSLPTPLYLLS